MKYLKMLGLAAVLAAAVMAIVGAGTASADELCTEPANAEKMCPAGKLIETVEASLEESALLEDTSGNVLDTCSEGGVAIRNINAANGNQTGSAAIKGSIAAADLTWNNCTWTTTTTQGGGAEATEAAGGGTTLKAKENIEVTIASPLGDCKYTSGPSLDLGSVANGGTTLAINVVVTKTNGTLCPSSARWNAKYKITNHTAAYYINN